MVADGLIWTSYEAHWKSKNPREPSFMQATGWPHTRVWIVNSAWLRW